MRTLKVANNSMALKEDMGRFKMLNFQVPYRRPLQNSLGQLRSIPSFGNLAESCFLVEAFLWL